MTPSASRGRSLDLATSPHVRLPPPHTHTPLQDIKPANVFINVEPRRAPGARRRVVLKLGDFGTTRERGRQQLSYFVAGFG